MKICYSTPITTKNIITTKRNLSFGSNSDEFNSPSQTLFNNLEQNEVKEIATTIDNNQNQIGSGWTANVFKHGDFAVKELKENPDSEELSHYLKSLPKDQQEHYFLNSLKNEFFALKFTQKAGITDSQKPVDIIRHKGKYYLISTIVKGKIANHRNSKITSEHLDDMTKKLTKLDKNGFIHQDLQLKNYFLQENKVGLIDFGAFSILGNNGEYSDPEAMSYNGLNLMSEEDKFNNDFKQKAAFRFSKNKLITHQGRNSNPYFNTFSNLANFEYRSLHYYLTGLAKDPEHSPAESKELFKNYLKLKAKNYHEPMAEFLASLSPEKIQKASSLSEEDSKETLRKAINYEKNSAKLLSEPSNEIIKSELYKLQLRYMASEHKGDTYKFEQLHKEYSNHLASMSKNANDELLNYIDDSREFSNIFRHLKGKAASSGIKLSENENIAELLFKTSKNITKEATKSIQEKSTVAKSSSKFKILSLMALGLSTIGGAVYYLKNKKNKPSVPTDLAIQKKQTHLKARPNPYNKYSTNYTFNTSPTYNAFNK